MPTDGTTSRLCVTTLALAVMATVAFGAPASGADRTFTLFGHANDGWGFTNETLKSPGPTITVDLGDNVTLILNATDGPNHNWFIDYDNDGTDDPTEPNSPNFQVAEKSWNFTADRAGTFTYRCKFHPTRMTGTIVIQEASPPGDSGGGDASAALLAGAVIIAIAAAAIVVLYLWRRPKPKK